MLTESLTFGAPLLPKTLTQILVTNRFPNILYCVMVQLLISARYQVSTELIFLIPIWIMVKQLMGEQCAMIYELNHHQFANSEHILKTNTSHFGVSPIPGKYRNCM